MGWGWGWGIGWGLYLDIYRKVRDGCGDFSCLGTWWLLIPFDPIFTFWTFSGRKDIGLMICCETAGTVGAALWLARATGWCWNGVGLAMYDPINAVPLQGLVCVSFVGQLAGVGEWSGTGKLFNLSWFLLNGANECFHPYSHEPMPLSKSPYPNPSFPQRCWH